MQSRISRKLLIAGLTLIMASCGGKSGKRNEPAQFPVNMSIYYAPLNTVWDVVLKTIRYDYLYNIALANKRNGFFATEEIRDYNALGKTKFRLNISLKFQGSGTVVVIYKDQQVFSPEKGWQRVETDYRLEHEILNKIQQRLQPR